MTQAPTPRRQTGPAAPTRCPPWRVRELLAQFEAARTSLASQTLIIVGGRRELDFLEVGRVVGLDPAREPGALHRLAAKVIERLDAQLPGAEMEHHQVPLVAVGRDEQVEALG